MAYQPEGFFLLFAQLRGEGVNEIVWIIGLGGGGGGGGGGKYIFVCKGLNYALRL